MNEHVGSQLGRRERQIVEVLYRLGKAGVAEVLAELPDPPSYSAVRALLRILEEKQRIIELLSSYVDTRQEAVRVVIGLEDTLPEMRNLVLIGAPARVGEQVVGSLAVIGPTPRTAKDATSSTTRRCRRTTRKRF